MKLLTPYWLDWYDSSMQIVTTCLPGTIARPRTRGSSSLPSSEIGIALSKKNQRNTKLYLKKEAAHQNESRGMKTHKIIQMTHLLYAVTCHRIKPHCVL